MTVTSEASYKSAILAADAAKKSAEHVLFMLRHPDAKPATAASDLGLPTDPRQTVPATAKAPPYDPSRVFDTAPSGATARDQTLPGVNIDMGGIVMGTLHDAQSIGDMVTKLLTSAWNAAMAGHPVSGALGGSYSMRGRPS